MIQRTLYVCTFRFVITSGRLLVSDLYIVFLHQFVRCSRFAARFLAIYRITVSFVPRYIRVHLSGLLTCVWLGGFDSEK